MKHEGPPNEQKDVLLRPQSDESKRKGRRRKLSVLNVGEQGKRERPHRQMASYEPKTHCVLGADEVTEMVMMMTLVGEDVKIG